MNQCRSLVCLLTLLLQFPLCSMLVAQEPSPSSNEEKTSSTTETITLGGGCFWCVEAVFQRLKGVSKVVSGYTGGHVENPTYEQVTGKKTGHAEVVQVTFDPEVLPLELLLEVFWYTHDPTTLNRQGNDYGPQYRSAVFYGTDKQRDVAEAVMKKLGQSKEFKKEYKNPIVTEITPLSVFYPAEDYHQNFYNLNRRNPYCQSVVAGKVRKFEKLFKEHSTTKK